MVFIDGHAQCDKRVIHAVIVTWARVCKLMKHFFRQQEWVFGIVI